MKQQKENAKEIARQLHEQYNELDTIACKLVLRPDWFLSQEHKDMLLTAMDCIQKVVSELYAKSR